MDLIAEQELLAIFTNGETARVVLKLGRPKPHPEIDWVCSAEAQGLRLWQGPTDFPGVGSWHALMMAQRFLREMLLAEVERGAVFHWEDGKAPMSIDELFCWHEIV